MKRFIALASIFVLIPMTVTAQQISKDENAVYMRLGNDIYAAGNFLNITENVADDLFLAGNHITVQSAVGGDLHAVGSNLTINGNIADDMRIFGGNVTVNGTIGGDLLLAGGTAYIGPNAVIEGNVLLGGGSVRIEGTIRGSMKLAGDDIAFLGTTRGAADIRGETVMMNGSVGGDTVLAGRTLTIDPATTIGGNLQYWSNAGTMDINATVGGSTTMNDALKRMERTQRHVKDSTSFAARMIGAISLFAVLSAALSIGVLQFSTKKFFIDVATRLRSAPGMSLTWGLIYFLLTPIVLLFIMITFIGIPLALALGAIYCISVLFAQVLTAMILARTAEKQWAPKKKQWHPAAVFFAALGIWIVMKFLWLIPVLGWIIVVLTVMTGIGAMLSVKWERFQQIA